MLLSDPRNLAPTLWADVVPGPGVSGVIIEQPQQIVNGTKGPLKVIR